MKFSPEDRATILRLAAAGILEELRATCDLADLVTLPLDAVGQMVGLGPRQVARVMPIRAMGARKLGVSLKEVQHYLTKQNQ